MANGLYAHFKELCLGTGANLTTATVKVVLVDTADYSVDLANHDYFDDVIAGARVATATLANCTITHGTFDADDATFTSVTGDQSEALVIYIDTGGADSTDPLVAYIDTVSSGLPVTPNGGNITVTWDTGTNKIFTL